MALSFQFLGLELSDRVIDWGQIEEIKEVLLVDSQLFTSETSIKIDNADDAFSQEAPASVLKGVGWYNKTATISKNGTSIFLGFVKDVGFDKQERTITLVLENIFSRPSETTVVASAASANPAEAIRALLISAGLQEYLDEASFANAGSQARATGATISYTWAEDDNVTVLNAVNSISQLSSISVLARGTSIFARAYNTYQGSGSQLGAPITNSTMLQFGPVQHDKESFANRVLFEYSAASTYTADAKDKQIEDRVVRVKQINAKTSEKLNVTNFASAKFFADLILERSKNRVDMINMTLGPEHEGIHAGDRHPVTEASYGYNSQPVEIIEVHQVINEDITDVLAVSLEG